MYVLVTYDVQTDSLEGQRRLRKVSRICMNYGQRVQNSVFECIVTEVQLAELKEKLKMTIDLQCDSIRIYFLNKNENRRIITMGHNNSINIEGFLLI